MKRCEWCLKYPLYIDYHDNEWGVPDYDDTKLFEMFNLEGAQAGLSWYTVLKKRENYRIAFDHWDAEKIASYDQKKIESLLADPGIIRNKLKVNAVVTNARLFLELKSKGKTFSDLVWSFVEHQPKINYFNTLSEIPAQTAESDEMCKVLKKMGFKFVGSTICYAFMQSCGMVDDHLLYCFKRRR